MKKLFYHSFDYDCDSYHISFCDSNNDILEVVSFSNLPFYSSNVLAVVIAQARRILISKGYFIDSLPSGYFPFHFSLDKEGGFYVR